MNYDNMNNSFVIFQKLTTLLYILSDLIIWYQFYNSNFSSERILDLNGNVSE